MKKLSLMMIPVVLALAACGGNEQQTASSSPAPQFSPAPAVPTETAATATAPAAPAATSNPVQITTGSPGMPASAPTPTGMAYNPRGGAVKIDIPHPGASSGPNTLRPETVNMEQALARLPRTTPQEAKAAVDRGALVLDVRNAMAYPKGHIAGSRNLPLAQFPVLMNSLPRDKTLITYCT